LNEWWYIGINPSSQTKPFSKKHGTNYFIAVFLFAEGKTALTKAV